MSLLSTFSSTALIECVKVYEKRDNVIIRRELRTVDGVTHNTFEETARAMGLLEDKTESHICMSDAREAGYDPGCLRVLFSLLIMEGAPALELYTLHKKFMASDFRYRRDHPLEEREADNKVLKVLSTRLESCGKTMSRYNLPEPRFDESEIDREISRYEGSECHKIYRDHMDTANLEQKQILKDIFNCVTLNSGGLIYLDGPPGRGKTFSLLTAVNYVRSKDQIALCCATTGFVAVMYPGGRTAHNLFKISVIDDPADLTPVSCDVGPNTERAELLTSASLIIWDEFTMANRENFEAVDVMIRKVRNCDRPMGGVLFVGAGDFRQIPPVVQYGSKEDILNASVRFSSHWKTFCVLRLTVPVRHQSDPEYAA